MSLSSSFGAGVAGLTANSTKISTISDNIANSGTYGYKRATADFNSFVLSSGRESATYGHGSASYSAGGVRASTGRDISQNGSLVATTNATDIAVSGRGFIPVTKIEDITETANNRSFYMASTGSFKADKNGYLVSDNGTALLAWPANSDGTFNTFSRNTTTDLAVVKIDPSQSVGDPTRSITLGTNLPATATTVTALSDPINLTVEYFDNVGTTQSMTVTFTPVVGGVTAGMSHQWTMMMTDNAAQAAAPTPTEIALTFSSARDTAGTLTNVTVATAGTLGAAYDATTGMLTLAGVGAVATNTVSMYIGIYGTTNGLTQLSDSFDSTGLTKDGSSVGNLTSIEIDEGGFVTATYDGGFTRKIYQIPVVDVNNINGLTTQSNQTFLVSTDSGDFFLWDAGDGPTGTITSYARETSTTDVAAELTNLIQTQRAYSSNAKVIQTVDEMLQETTNIKR